MTNQHTNVTGTEYRPSTSGKTFSSVITSDTFPSKNQAIIFSHIDGAPAAYYTRKVAQKLGNADNILHCIKISKDRLRIYLKTREIAEKFMNEAGEIVINRTTVKAI